MKRLKKSRVSMSNKHKVLTIWDEVRQNVRIFGTATSLVLTVDWTQNNTAVRSCHARHTLL